MILQGRFNPEKLRVIIQVRPGNPLDHDATIFESAETPEQLTNRLKIMLKSPTPEGREKLMLGIELAVRTGRNYYSRDIPHIIDLSALFNDSILSDGFGADYPLWIPGRGWNGVEISNGRDNPQQFLA